MIKEKKKNTKYNATKTKMQVLAEYLRTVFCTFLLALALTTMIAMHARNEMIKNIYSNPSEMQMRNKQAAIEIISKTDMLKDLSGKNYSVCLRVGELYETAGNYKSAQLAYETAVQKARIGVYTPYYKLLCVLVEQEKFDDANQLLNSISDYYDKNLIKFKTRSYMTMGDKYYSQSKFLSAAKSYEKADFYYKKFSKKDAVIEDAIQKRIVNSYILAADLIVKSKHESEALRFLKKAEAYDSENLKIKYKIAIILSELEPEESIPYFDELLDKIPQNIDYDLYTNTLMKAANIADLSGRPTKAKHYRYKIHSMDLFINRKIVYKDDVEIGIKSFKSNKVFFTYPLRAEYYFLNTSNYDIINLQGDFVLCVNGKPIETVTKTVADKDSPLFAFSNRPNEISVKFTKLIFTAKELENYTIKIYLYKDEKYKTLVFENKIPKRSF